MRVVIAGAAILAALFVAVFVGSRTFGASLWPGEGAAATADDRGPRERLNERDMAIARRAVPRWTQLGPPWRELPVRSNGGGGRCPGYDPDLSGFTVTGKARSSFKAEAAFIETSVRVFPDRAQAAGYFSEASAAGVVRCMRLGVEERFEAAGVPHGFVSTRSLTGPRWADQASIYVLTFWIEGSDGTRYEYPVDVFTFQAGRGVGAISFSFMAGKRCEYALARTVAETLLRETTRELASPSSRSCGHSA